MKNIFPEFYTEGIQRNDNDPNCEQYYSHKVQSVTKVSAQNFKHGNLT